MLDIETLRVAQALVSVTAFALIFFGTYRNTRSPYAGWWSVVVGAAGLGSLAYLLALTPLEAAAAPLGNALGVASGAAVAGAARALRGARTRWWAIAAVAAVAAIATVVENPHGAAWPAGLAVPTIMAMLIGYSALQYWRIARRRNDLDAKVVGPEAASAMVAIAIAVSIVSLFYVTRVAIFIAMGAESDLYGTLLGPAATTLAVCAAMVVVAYSVAQLSRYEVTEGWKLRATHDDLTGLLTRDAFREQADRALSRGRGRGATLILADFDHFKRLNDEHGHAMGDRALAAFGDVCRHVLSEGEIAGRWGGEEFILLLRFGGTERARTVTASLSKGVGRVGRRDEEPLTLSYGIAAYSAEVPFDALVARADDALYRAKDAGRDCSIVYGSTAGS